MSNGELSVNAMLLFSILSFADDNTKICIQFAWKKKEETNKNKLIWMCVTATPTTIDAHFNCCKRLLFCEFQTFHHVWNIDIDTVDTCWLTRPNSTISSTNVKLVFGRGISYLWLYLRTTTEETKNRTKCISIKMQQMWQP